jgi:hypothetical protein
MKKRICLKESIKGGIETKPTGMKLVLKNLEGILKGSPRKVEEMKGL